MSNLSQHRLTGWQEIKEILNSEQGEAFLEYQRKVYQALLALSKGQRIDIDRMVRPANREWFVKIGCLFIWDGHTDYEFASDYSHIRRLPEPKPQQQPLYEIHRDR